MIIEKQHTIILPQVQKIVDYLDSQSKSSESNQVLLKEFKSLQLQLECTFLPTEDIYPPFTILLNHPQLSGKLVELVMDILKLFMDVGMDVSALVPAVCKCRFVGGAIVADEVTLCKISLFLKNAISTCSLSNQQVCLIFERLFEVTQVPRVNPIFREIVECCILEAFSRMIDRINFDENFSSSQVAVDGPKHEEIIISWKNSTDSDSIIMDEVSLNGDKEDSEGAGGGEEEEEAPAVPSHPNTFPAEPIHFNIFSLQSLLHFLITIIDPSSTGIKRNKTHQRLVKLTFLIWTEFIENHHLEIKRSEALIKIVAEKLCCVLIHLLEMDHIDCSDVILNVFGRFSDKLIPQFELLLKTIIGALNKKEGTSKRKYLRLLTTLSLDPLFIQNLYVFYECQVGYGEPLRELGECLSRIASNPVHDNAKSAAMEESIMSLSILQNILSNCLKPSKQEQFDGDAADASDLSPSHLTQLLAKKKLLQHSAKLFLKKPAEAFEFLVENQLLSPQKSPKELAQYLRRTPLLDKRVIGEIISKPSNEEILHEYLTDFHFTGLRIDEALRRLLEGFRLPGEAQQISRIMESFSQVYYDAIIDKAPSAASPTATISMAPFKNTDAVFVLGYSIIMLNTDQHNHQVKHKMSLEDFIRNNRGINDGSDFPPSFLTSIYEAIRGNEIVMPLESKDAWKWIWNEQLKLTVAKAIPPAPTFAYLADVLEILWTPILEGMERLLLNPRDQKHCKLSISILEKLANIVCDCSERKREGGSLVTKRFDVTEIARILANSIAFKDITNTSIGNQLNRYLARAELFQLLVSSYFQLYASWGQWMGGEGWSIFFDHLLYLHSSDLIGLEDFAAYNNISSLSTSPNHTRSLNLDTLAAAASEDDGGDDDRVIGLFGTLGSWVTGGHTSKSENSAKSAPKIVDENTKLSRAFMAETCRWSEILLGSKLWRDEAIALLMDEFSRFIKAIERPLKWPLKSLMFLTHLMADCACINRDRLGLFWPNLSNCLDAQGKNATIPSALREACIIGLGRILLLWLERNSGEKGGDAEIIGYLQLICHLPPIIFHNIAETVLGIILCIIQLHYSQGSSPGLSPITSPSSFEESSPASMLASAETRLSMNSLSVSSRTDPSIWPHYFTVLSLAGKSKSLGPYSFGLLSLIVTETEILFPIDFFSEYIDLLSAFIKMNSNIDDSVAEEALNKLVRLEAIIRNLYISDVEGWNEHVIPVHAAIAQQSCHHPSAHIRSMAIGNLQKIILSLSAHFQSQGDAVPDAEALIKSELRLVLIPLLEELIKCNADAKLGEIQVRSSSLMAKFILNNLSRIFKPASASTLTLWQQILDVLIKLVLLPTNNDLIRESLPETMKNMLLVMRADGVTGPIWDICWETIDPVIPGIHEAIQSLDDEDETCIEAIKKDLSNVRLADDGRKDHPSEPLPQQPPHQIDREEDGDCVHVSQDMMSAKEESSEESLQNALKDIADNVNSTTSPPPQSITSAENDKDSVLAIDSNQSIVATEFDLDANASSSFPAQNSNLDGATQKNGGQEQEKTDSQNNLSTPKSPPPAHNTVQLDSDNDEISLV